jgi:hypothetical protein
MSEHMLQKLSNVAGKVIHPKLPASDYIARYSSMAVALKESDLVVNEEDEESEVIDGEMVSYKKKIRREIVTSPMGLFLNLLITFLYQANQYVVAPSSGKYSELLGMSPILSGAIIGLTPFAAIISALVFSAWSNHSYKQPLLASLVMLIIGNFLYGYALQCNSAAMIFCGRLLTGFGAPRGISRRYIADHVSLKDRTAASSHFITAGAMGLTAGPLISALVSTALINVTTSVNDHTIIVFNDVTAPGWIMFVSYLVCLVLVLVYFEDPLEYLRLFRGYFVTRTPRNTPSSNSFYHNQTESDVSEFRVPGANMPRSFTPRHISRHEMACSCFTLWVNLKKCWKYSVSLLGRICCFCFCCCVSPNEHENITDRRRRGEYEVIVGVETDDLMYSVNTDNNASKESYSNSNIPRNTDMYSTNISDKFYTVDSTNLQNNKLVIQSTNHESVSGPVSARSSDKPSLKSDAEISNEKHQQNNHQNIYNSGKTNNSRSSNSGSRSRQSSDTMPIQGKPTFDASHGIYSSPTKPARSGSLNDLMNIGVSSVSSGEMASFSRAGNLSDGNLASIHMTQEDRQVASYTVSSSSTNGDNNMQSEAKFDLVSPSLSTGQDDVELIDKSACSSNSSISHVSDSYMTVDKLRVISTNLKPSVSTVYSLSSRPLTPPLLTNSKFTDQTEVFTTDLPVNASSDNMTKFLSEKTTVSSSTRPKQPFTILETTKLDALNDYSSSKNYGSMTNTFHPSTIPFYDQLSHVSRVYGTEKMKNNYKTSSAASLLSVSNRDSHIFSLLPPYEEDTSCFCSLISVEVGIVLFIYFINKIGQEIVVSSVPTLCGSMFGWDARIEGFYMAAMGVESFIFIFEFHNHSYFLSHYSVGLSTSRIDISW